MLSTRCPALEHGARRSINRVPHLEADTVCVAVAVAEDTGDGGPGRPRACSPAPAPPQNALLSRAALGVCGQGRG